MLSADAVIYFPLTLADSLALALFLSAWVGYTIYAKYRAKRSYTLSSLMRRHREQWMREMLRRENRISDATIIGNLERVVTFFASTTILILAGLLTAIFASENLLKVLANLHLSGTTSVEVIQFKLFVMVLIFVYAFFKFTWSVREHIFSSILIGSAPQSSGLDNLSADKVEKIALQAAKMSDLANHDFNHGLRAYYFALALLGWLVNGWILLIATLWVIAVLYGREFNSKALQLLRED
ncbi:MAG: hypothetical protein VR73_06815 [Gammaproteobacteria bacterium BRH_c0]|nr:MAG: hypothetical protein VR73_06815 [Gammaproteobacteria bacterium BRH_c0]